MGIGVVIRVQVAVCGMRCIDLKKHTLKSLGSHFSYNEIFKIEKKMSGCDRYSRSFEKVEYEKTYTRKENGNF